MKKKPPAVFHCAYCGARFERKNYEANKKTKHGRCCSPSCRAKHIAKFNPSSQPDRVKMICKVCGKEYEIQKYRLKESSCCSRACSASLGLLSRWSGEKETVFVNCNFCKKQKEVLKWDYEQKKKRGQEHFYCNSKCFGEWKSFNWGQENNPSWKGGYAPYYGANWKRQARKARARDGHKCCRCGVNESELGRSLDVHHIVRFADFNGDWQQANKLSNLISYCHSCHMRVEGKR
jgi:hypothetical protein